MSSKLVRKILGWRIPGIDGHKYRIHTRDLGGKFLLLRTFPRARKHVRTVGREASVAPDPIPLDLVGDFIVWSEDGRKIAGHGKTIEEARAMAGAGPDDARVVQKVPQIPRFRTMDGRAVTSEEAAESLQADIITIARLREETSNV